MIIMSGTLLYCLLLLLLSSFPLITKGQMLEFQDDTPDIIKDKETVRREWKRMEAFLKDLVSQATKMVMPAVMDNGQGLNISSTCMRQGLQLFGALQKLKTWAMRFLDASAKSVDGVITGTVFNFGAYDECIDTVAINERTGRNKGEVMFTGKYCTLRVKTVLPPKKSFYKSEEELEELKGLFKEGTIMHKVSKFAHFLHSFPVRIGICVPSGCSEEDLNQMFATASTHAPVYMRVKRCEVKEENKYTPTVIGVMCVYSLAGFMLFVGTIVDIYCYYSKKELRSTPVRVLLAFSLMSNFRKFTDISSSSSQSLGFIHGIRFLSMSWIILGHSYIMAIFQVVGGLDYVRFMVQDFAFQAVLNGSLAVETFFVLGGFLVCYVTIKLVKIDHHPFNFKMFVLHRLWRILPVYIFVVLFMFLSNLLVSGPIAHDTLAPFIKGCEQNWWSNFLFINNYYYGSYLPCLPYSWYLALDMQFYISSVIILLLLFRWPTIGISLCGLLTIVSMIAGAVVTTRDNLPPAFLAANPNVEHMNKYLLDYYWKPYGHAGPYLVGIVTGYFLVMSPKFKIPKVVQLFGWTCSIITSMAVVYGTYPWNGEKDPTYWETIFYAGCHRTAWALCISWIIICCGTGHGGIVNYILSWKVWIPLGRLTYVAYLVHAYIEVVFTAGVRNTFHPTHSMAVWVYFGHLAVTYGIAFAGSMLVESPFLALEKIFLKRYTKKPQPPAKTPKEVNYRSSHSDGAAVLENGSQVTVFNSSIAPHEESGNLAVVYKL